MTGLVEIEDVEGLTEEALREHIEGCDYLIGLGYDKAHHEGLRAECLRALEKFLPPQDDPKETASAPTKVKLATKVPGRSLSRPFRAWEKRAGLDQPFVGEEDEFYRIILNGRPRTRGDCKNVPRPCPFVGCRHHLWMEVLPSSQDVKPNLPNVLPWEMPHASCSLDVVEDNDLGMTLSDIGTYFKISRERIRQVETIVLKHILSTLGEMFHKDYFPLDNASTDEYGEDMPDKVKARIGIK